MANSKISALPSATTPLAGTEVLPVVQGGVTEQVSVANLTAGRNVSASGLFVDANSATDAVRITQLGTGNALLVEDSANPDSTPVVITNVGKTGFATAAPAATVHVAGDTILSNVNVIGASYDSVSFSVTAEEATPSDLFFSPDGLKMYIIGTTGDDVNEYNLSTAWVVSSAVFVTSFSVNAQESSPQGLFFRADGTKMYIIGATNDTIFQYALSTPWSVATASYESISFSVAAQEINPTGLSFRPNGLSMYVVGTAGDSVNQYTLSTAWNVSTATFLQSFSIAGQEGNGSGLAFTGDGSRMFVSGSTGDDVNVYNLTTPWNISTSVSVGAFSVSAQDTVPIGIYIKPDGTKMYIVGQTNDTVFQYTVPSIDIQLTGPTSVAALDVQQNLTVYGNTQAYKISASGNVGIGTSAPSQKLEIYAAANSLQIESVVRNDQAGTGVAAIGFNVSSSASSETTSTKAGIGLVRTNAYGVGALCFYNNGTGSAGNFTTADERMRIDTNGNVLVTSAAGLGYGAGSGGTVTQATSKGTTVTLNKPTGQITMNNAALLPATSVAFQLNNSLIGIYDTLICAASQNANYSVETLQVGAGGCAIRVTNITAGSLSEALVINFAIIKGSIT
jgi:hypothetical protein